jgi:hypothetical protein
MKVMSLYELYDEYIKSDKHYQIALSQAKAGSNKLEAEIVAPSSLLLIDQIEKTKVTSQLISMCHHDIQE